MITKINLYSERIMIAMMNIAFAGFRHGHIYVLYDEVIKHPNAALTGCFEENEAERKKAAESRGIDFNYGSYEEILQDPKVDTVAIGDYYSKRGKMVIEALKHGKHVICDKPLCTSLTELDEIERLAAETGCKVQCMFELRFSPETQTVRSLIANGEIGKVLNAGFTAQHFLNYGVRPDWYFKEGCHGGTINDIAIHGIDILRYLTGKELTGTYAARCWNAFAEAEPNFKDSAQFMIEMDGMAVMADVSYSAPKCPDVPTYWNFNIFGTEGLITFKSGSGKVSVYKDDCRVIECERPERSFVDCLAAEIRGESSLITTADTIISTHQALTVQAFADKNRA